MNSEVITIRVPSELKSQLECLGKTLHRSKSYLAQQAISQYVAENAWQIEQLSQATQEIKQGKFVSDDAVNQYLDSWGSSNEQTIPKPK